MRPLKYSICDVFTSRPLQGNQLAVFTNAMGLRDELMQDLAREMNFSETTFILPPAKGGHARVRIFTPRRELPFAGHPVLGTAFVVGGAVESERIVLELEAGLVPVDLEREAARPVFGWMEQPRPTVAPFADAVALLAALGVPEARFPIEQYDNGPQHVMVVVDSPDTVAELDPDMAGIARVVRGCVTVCALADGFVKSRVFAPGEGITEDPATGSAAGPLALHLCRHGALGFGERVEIRQGAEIGRPSFLYAEVHGSEDAVEVVRVGGSAVVSARGEFRLPLVGL